MTNQLENKIDKMQQLYKEINKELCELIGDRTIDLVDDYLYDEDTVIYWIGADQYNVKSVCVNKETTSLAFNVFLVTTDTDGYIQTYEDVHSFEEIPCNKAIYLLEKVCNIVKGGIDSNEN